MAYTPISKGKGPGTAYTTGATPSGVPISGTSVPTTPTAPAADTWKPGYVGTGVRDRIPPTKIEETASSSEDAMIDRVVDLWEKMGFLKPESQPPVTLSDAEIGEIWDTAAKEFEPYYKEEAAAEKKEYEQAIGELEREQRYVQEDVDRVIDELGIDRETLLSRAGEDLRRSLLQARQGYAARGLTFSGIRAGGEQRLEDVSGRQTSDIETQYARDLAAEKQRLTRAGERTGAAKTSQQSAYDRALQQLSRQQRDVTQSAFRELKGARTGVYESFLR